MYFSGVDLNSTLFNVISIAEGNKLSFIGY